MGKILIFALLFVLPWGVHAETAADACERAYKEQVSAYAQNGVDGTDNKFLESTRDECLKTALKERQTDESNLEKCTAEVKPKVEQCHADLSAAAAKCDIQKLKGVKIDAEEIKSTEGVSAAADASAKLSGQAKDAYSKFSSDCEPVQKKCTQACTEAKNALTKCLEINQHDTSILEQLGVSYNKLTSNVEACESFTGKIAEAKDAAAKAASAEDDAKKAGESTEGSTGGGAEKTASADGEKKKGGGGFNMPDLSGLMNQQQQPQPMQTPIAAAASAGCDNPANTDRVCQCLRNPQMCQTVSSSGGADGLSGTTDFSSGSGSPGSFDPGINGNNFDGVGGMNPTGQGSEVGGKQGNGAPIGGGDAFSGAGGGGGGRGGGVPPNDFSVKVNSGFYGGASGGGRGGGAGGTPTGSAANSVALAVEKPDLSKFLPGQKYDPNRGPASLVGKDGVTGPYDFNWDKMHRQFRRLDREGNNFLP